LTVPANSLGFRFDLYTAPNSSGVKLTLEAKWQTWVDPKGAEGVTQPLVTKPGYTGGTVGSCDFLWDHAENHFGTLGLTASDPNSVATTQFVLDAGETALLVGNDCFTGDNSSGIQSVSWYAELL
jgi:hypothetical protein